MRCFFQKRLGDCQGISQRAHWVPKQRLRKELDENEVWDKRCWTLMCAAHHHRFDKGFLRLRLEDYPAVFLEYAADHGLFWAGERDGWRFEAKVAR